MISINIATAEEINRTYDNIIATEKKKLIDSVHGQTPLPKALVNLLNIITKRQLNIIKRAQLITQHKLSFFDDAPTVTEEETVAGITIGANV